MVTLHARAGTVPRWPARLLNDWPTVAWLAAAVIINIAGAMGAPEAWRQMVHLTDLPTADRSQLRATLADVHLSPVILAWFQIATGIAGTLVNMFIGWLLVRRAARTGFMIYLAFIMLAMTNANYPPDIDDLLPGHPIAQVVIRLATAVAITGFFTLPFLFPNGRFVPRWTVIWWLYLAFSVFSFAFFPDFGFHSRLWTVFDAIGTTLLILSLLYAVIYRYRRVSTPSQQRQTKWVAFGLGIGVPGFFAGDAMMRQIDATPVGIACLLGFLIIMPIATNLPFATIGIAMLRQGLYDIDVILNRTFVWMAMTLAVIGTYIAIVIGLGSLIGSRGDLLLSIITTGFVAVAFQPVRDRVQRLVNRLLYGERDDPYAVLARLGHRLEGALAHEEILPGIVRTLSDALRLPYAAILLRDGFQSVQAAAAGSPVAGVVRFPLVYQNEAVGELVVAPRSPGEQFGPADQRLLADLARQISVAVHAVQLTTDLQRSRQNIVTVLEEERRRLRRDLHDGLGSQLAALSIQTTALRNLIPTDPSTAESLAAEIRGELKGAVADIRRLVHGLRPPALDELGLLGALQQRASHYATGAGIDQDDSVASEHTYPAVTVVAPEPLPSLPAAVEVAAYRIAEEALTNVVRHSKAIACTVRLEAGDDLVISVEDNGLGFPLDRPPGVGLSSMRERAHELGGRLVIGPGQEGRGTRIEARVPLPSQEPGSDV